MTNTTLPVYGVTNGINSNPSYETANLNVETVVAVMYNYYDSSLIYDNSASLITNTSNTITLNPYGVNPFDGSNCVVIDISGSIVTAMTEESFLALFYSTNAGYFNVNPTNTNNPAVILSKQTFTSDNGTENNFSLVQFLLRVYTTNKAITVNSLDPRILILVQKEAFQVQSLAQIKGTTYAMSWDEVINSLLTSGVINTSENSSDYIIVPLTVVFNYHSFVLDTDLSIKITYLVNISGYTAQPSSAA